MMIMNSLAVRVAGVVNMYFCLEWIFDLHLWYPCWKKVHSSVSHCLEV